MTAVLVTEQVAAELINARAASVAKGKATRKRNAELKRARDEHNADATTPASQDDVPALKKPVQPEPRGMVMPAADDDGCPSDLACHDCAIADRCEGEGDDYVETSPELVPANEHSRPLVDIEHDIAALSKTMRRDIFTMGALLIEAKRQVLHGDWLPWLKDHFGNSERTANNYMNAARLLAKSATVADLKLSDGAVYWLADPTATGLISERSSELYPMTKGYSQDACQAVTALVLEVAKTAYVDRKYIDKAISKHIQARAKAEGVVLNTGSGMRGGNSRHAAGAWEAHGGNMRSTGDYPHLREPGAATRTPTGAEIRAAHTASGWAAAAGHPPAVQAETTAKIAETRAINKAGFAEHGDKWEPREAANDCWERKGDPGHVRTAEEQEAFEAAKAATAEAARLLEAQALGIVGDVGGRTKKEARAQFRATLSPEKLAAFDLKLERHTAFRKAVKALSDLVPYVSDLMDVRTDDVLTSAAALLMAIAEERK